MPRWLQITLCWLLFAGAMALLSLLLHAFVPPVLTSLQDTIGIGTVGILMLIGWLVLAFFGYRPLLRNWLARRRSARIRQR